MIKRLFSSISDPKKATVIAIISYSVCLTIAVFFMSNTGMWVSRWFAPGVLAFGAIVGIFSAWKGGSYSRVELAAMWPIGLGLLSGLIIDMEGLIYSKDHVVPYVAVLVFFSLILAVLRVSFLIDQLKSKHLSVR